MILEIVFGQTVNPISTRGRGDIRSKTRSQRSYLDFAKCSELARMHPELRKLTENAGRGLGSEYIVTLNTYNYIHI